MVKYGDEKSAPAAPASGSMAGRRENNFTALRLMAAMFVFAGHMGGLAGTTIPSFCGISLHELGVSLLFLESGYLITLSWERDPHPVRYILRRFLRLWPPLAAFVLVMAFVAGPLLSELGVRGYFGSSYLAYLKNLRFYIVFSLPGVFTGLPYSHSVNGSLWSLPAEALMYLVTPVLFTVLTRRGKRKLCFPAMAVLTAGACGLDFYLRTAGSGHTLIFYGVDWISAWHLIAMYLIGMLFTCDRMRRSLNLQAAFAALSLWLMLQLAGLSVSHLFYYLVLPWTAFSFALSPAPVFRNMGKRMELSYGIYLYGFFFEQLTLFLQQKYGVTLSYLQNFVLSLIPTLAASVLSYYLTELPFRKLTRLLTRRRDKTEKESGLPGEEQQKSAEQDFRSGVVKSEDAKREGGHPDGERREDAAHG